jgi:dinuclear metal center YbgI/SA1388 family protein
MRLDELTAYLLDYLSLDDVPDYPNALNGLQVEGGGEVGRVMTAVDASVASANAAAERGADMLIVHHGLFWEGLKPLTGRMKRRIEPLVMNRISLYSAHLPLDAHPEVGNNVLLAEALELRPAEPFGEFMGIKIGLYAECDLMLSELAARLEERLGAHARVVRSGGERAARVAVVSGGAASCIAEAAREGMDTLVTGELPHHAYLEATELGLNVIYAGHYSTETLGVKALGEHLNKKFGLAHEFFDYPTGL